MKDEALKLASKPRLLQYDALSHVNTPGILTKMKPVLRSRVIFMRLRLLLRLRVKILMRLRHRRIQLRLRLRFLPY
jgi:hypothetical protein